MAMNRGDFVLVAMSGDFGKPRPALVIQSDKFLNDVFASVTVLLMSSEIIDAPLIRLTVEPDENNGLFKSSQIMIDKPMTVLRSKIGGKIGYANKATLKEVDAALAVFLGIV
jgi:mRNA interferase MazF